MKKLSKELQREIADGQHSALMQGIEELIDMYHNKSFEAGYESAKDDVCVHSLRLAEHIKDSAPLIGHKIRKNEDVHVVEVDDLAKLIEEYFENALKA